jgi:hypothetical protein
MVNQPERSRNANNIYRRFKRSPYHIWSISSVGLERGANNAKVLGSTPILTITISICFCQTMDVLSVVKFDIFLLQKPAYLHDSMRGLLGGEKVSLYNTSDFLSGLSNRSRNHAPLEHK